MPPRIRSSNLPSATSLPLRPQTASQPAKTSREFSQSTCRQVTLRRKKFYEWLNGPGRALKQPLPKSTNYLGAYDKYGNLVRATRGGQQQFRGNEKKEDVSNTDALVTEEVEGKDKKPEGQESADELEMEVRRQEDEEKTAKKKDQQGDELPPETLEDLRPFPLNKFFRSQPVLSEELREAIYQSVVKEERTVALASVMYGVSNERVGAVVRLKQIEKEWIAQVRFQLVEPALHQLDVMKLFKIRLVFKTPTWLQTQTLCPI